MAGVAGETVWVTLYIGLGYSFGTQLTWIGDILGDFIGFVTAFAVALGLGLYLLVRRLATRATRAGVSSSE